MSEGILSGLIFVLAMLPVPAAIATAYLWRWWWRSNELYDEEGGLIGTEGPRSWVLRLFALGSTVKLIGATMVSFLAARRLLGLEPLEWGASATVLAVLALEVMPIVYALEFRARSSRAERRASDDARRERRRDVADAAREVRRDQSDARRETLRDDADRAREEGTGDG